MDTTLASQKTHLRLQEQTLLARALHSLPRGAHLSPARSYTQLIPETLQGLQIGFTPAVPRQLPVSLRFSSPPNSHSPRAPSSSSGSRGRLDPSSHNSPSHLLLFFLHPSHAVEVLGLQRERGVSSRAPTTVGRAPRAG